MAFEIELKTRLESDEPIKTRLHELGNYCHSHEKLDSYWYPAKSDLLSHSGIRLRRESIVNADNTARESILVTFKNKKISEGMEINDEREFSVSNAIVFEEMMEYLGLHKIIIKQKSGWAWTIPPILAELSLVAGLGWFLELEIIADNNDAQTVDICRKQLLSLLANLEIPADRIEPRPYTVLLSAPKNS